MMSNIFLISGLLLSIVIIIFFCNLFIIGQKQRITIERIMGLSKKECKISILSGLVLVSVAGIITGCMLGASFTRYALRQLTDIISYDSFYSITMVYSTEINNYESMNGSFWTVAITAGLLIFSLFIISGLYIKKILDDEPLEMLGKIAD